MLRELISDGILSDWVRRMRDAEAGPNDAATVQAALAHRDALLPLRDRARWLALRCTDGSIRKDQEVSDGIPGCVAKSSRVRFAV